MTKVGVALLLLSLALGIRSWMLWEDTTPKSVGRIAVQAEQDRTPSLVVAGMSGVVFLAGVVVVSVSEARRPIERS